MLGAPKANNTTIQKYECYESRNKLLDGIWCKPKYCKQWIISSLINKKYKK